MVIHREIQLVKMLKPVFSLLYQGPANVFDGLRLVLKVLDITPDS